MHGATIEIIYTLCSSFKVRGQVIYRYGTTGNVIVPCILIFMFPDSEREDRMFSSGWQQAFPESNLLLVSSCMYFYLLPSLPNPARLHSAINRQTARQTFYYPQNLIFLLIYLVVLESPPSCNALDLLVFLKLNQVPI
jgi:hypothetical protein